jgi:hypothetical protein
MEDLAKSVIAGLESFARQRDSSAKLLVPGNVVISGRAARSNKPSPRNGGVNLAEEVEPQPKWKTSSRLAKHSSVRIP